MENFNVLCAYARKLGGEHSVNVYPVEDGTWNVALETYANDVPEPVADGEGAHIEAAAIECLRALDIDPIL